MNMCIGDLLSITVLEISCLDWACVFLVLTLEQVDHLLQNMALMLCYCMLCNFLQSIKTWQACKLLKWDNTNATSFRVLK